MKLNRSPRVAFILFNFLLVLILISTTGFETQAAAKKKGRAASKKSARAAKSSRSNRRSSARSSRRGRGMSKRELRAERARAARDQAAHIAKLQRRAGRKLTKRELAAEMRRYNASHRRGLAERRRRAEAARQAAIARQRAIEEGVRNEVQANIANDTTAGEDLEVRKVAVEALGRHMGTVVVMDPKTGRVYTVVNQEWGLRRGFKPCSTIKLVTGVAGISEKVVSPFESVSDGGAYRIDLTDALAYSNNTYFQRIGGTIGFDKMVSYAREMGLGEKTGINYANEYAGKVPLFKTGFAVNRMSSHGDDFEVTAIQLATMVSAMSNGGKLITPHVPRTVEENSQFKTEVRRKLSISDDTWRRMLPGMIGAVNYGSGRKAYRPDQTVAGKTGTCIGQGSWLGLFTSYAPVVNPRLAVVVITRGSDARNHLPAAVAGNIYRALSPRFGTLINFQVAENADDATPGDKKAAALDEEAQERKAQTEAEANAAEEAAQAEADKGTEAGATKTTTGPVTPESKSKVKATVMPIDNKTKQPAKPSTTPATAPAKPEPDGRQRKIQPNP